MKVYEALEKVKELNKQVELLVDIINSLEEESDRTKLLRSIILEKQKERDSLQKRLGATSLVPEPPHTRVYTSDFGSVIGK